MGAGHRRISTNGADLVTAESSQFARIAFRSADPGPESPKSPIGPDRSPSIPPDSSPAGEAVRLNRPIGREFGRSGCERSGGPRLGEEEGSAPPLEKMQRAGYAWVARR